MNHLCVLFVNLVILFLADSALSNSLKPEGALVANCNHYPLTLSRDVVGGGAVPDVSQTSSKKKSNAPPGFIKPAERLL